MSNDIRARMCRAPAALCASLAGLALLLAGCGEREESQATVSDTTAPASAKAIPGDKFRHLKDTSFIRFWDLELGSRIERSWLSPAVPELVFFQTANDHAVVAVDAMSGATRWVTIPMVRTVRLPPYVSRTPLRDQGGHTYYDDRLYLVSDDTLFCFDLGSGQVIWRLLLPFSPSTGPMAVGTESDLRLFIGDTEGRVRVITQHVGGGVPYEIWQYNLLTDLNAAPTGFENLVYVGDHQGNMRCFALDRDQRWSFPGGGLITGSAVARERVLYFGNTDNILYAINRLTGEKYGQFNFNGQVNRPPFFYRGEPHRLYVWVDHADPDVSGVYALRTEPSSISFADNSSDHPHPPMEVVRLGQDWHFPGASRLVGSTPQHLFLTYPNSDVVLAVRRDSGTLEWAWDVNEERSPEHRVTLLTQYEDPTDENRTIYTADDTGRVIAYRFFGYVPPSPEAPPPVTEQQELTPVPHKKPAAGAAAPAAGAAPAPADKPAGDTK